jgi:hypothetical protein
MTGLLIAVTAVAEKAAEKAIMSGEVLLAGVLMPLDAVLSLLCGSLLSYSIIVPTKIHLATPVVSPIIIVFLCMLRFTSISLIALKQSPNST